jgi:hypothetical protein
MLCSKPPTFPSRKLGLNSLFFPSTHLEHHPDFKLGFCEMKPYRFFLTIVQSYTFWQRRSNKQKHMSDNSPYTCLCRREGSVANFEEE